MHNLLAIKFNKHPHSPSVKTKIHRLIVSGRARQQRDLSSFVIGYACKAQKRLFAETHSSFSLFILIINNENTW
jgi:hypothetical protein